MTRVGFKASTIVLLTIVSTIDAVFQDFMNLQVSTIDYDAAMTFPSEFKKTFFSCLIFEYL